MDGIVFSRLNEIVKNPEVISEKKQAENGWGIMPYETAEVQGNALVAPEDSFPADVVLDPNLSGWYRRSVRRSSQKFRRSTVSNFSLE